LPCPSLFLFCCSKSFPPPPTMCAWSWLLVMRNFCYGGHWDMTECFCQNSYSSCHTFEWGFRVYAESAHIGCHLLWKLPVVFANVWSLWLNKAHSKPSWCFVGTSQ
jgi:hypothetical protein